MTTEVERPVMCIFYGDCQFNMMDCEEDTPHYQCRKRITAKMVRVRYWVQETLESGYWTLTGLMPAEAAIKMHQSGALEMSEIVEDSEYT